VTVHNVGHRSVGAGVPLAVFHENDAGERRTFERWLPEVPARGAVTVSVPWALEDRAVAHRIGVVVDRYGTIVDDDRTSNSAEIALRPPRLDIDAPGYGTIWGGNRVARWHGSSDEGALTYTVALATAGGPFTALGPAIAAEEATIDTARLPDGECRLRVTASDGILSTSREVPFRIANSGLAVRSFENGAATATLAASGGNTGFLVPADAWIEDATLLLDAVPAKTTAIRPTPVWGAPPTLVSRGGALYAFYTESSAVWMQRSGDHGATWSAAQRVSPLGVTVTNRAVAENAAGLHAFYQVAGNPIRTYHRRSADGLTWSDPVELPAFTSLIDASASDGGVAAWFVYGHVAVGAASGDSWSLAEKLDVEVRAVALEAGRLHALLWGSGLPYRAADIENSVAAGWSPPVMIEEAFDIGRAEWIPVPDGLAIAYNAYLPLYELRVQRCGAGRDCTRREGWLPTPILLAERGLDASTWVAKPRPDLATIAWPVNTYPASLVAVRGPESASRWGTPAEAPRSSTFGSRASPPRTSPWTSARTGPPSSPALGCRVVRRRWRGSPPR
jgi:hypothetical protein